MAEQPITEPTPDQPLAVLVSGGADSAILTARSTRTHPAVTPIYIRSGLAWEEVELAYLQQFLAAVACPTLRPLVILSQPTADLYGQHWSITGQDVPRADLPDPDAAVYLPGRNVLLLAKSLLWCHLHNVPQLAMAPLEANPFPDATPAFFTDFARIVSQAVAGQVRVVTPYAGYRKSQVLRLGSDLPLGLTFSCMQPRAGRHCGSCAKCGERQAGFRDAGLPDPTDYFQEPTCSV
jgi:7-cyano-7-deazaguanine synthase